MDSQIKQTLLIKPIPVLSVLVLWCMCACVLLRTKSRPLLIPSNPPSTKVHSSTQTPALKGELFSLDKIMCLVTPEGLSTHC